MKTFRTGAVLVGGAILALVVAGTAEARENRPPRGERRGVQMSRRLGIDTGTARQLGELLREARDARKEKMEEIRNEMRDLQELLENESSASQIDAQLDRIADLRDEMHEARKQSQTEIRRLLGPEASAKFLLGVMDRRRRGGGDGGGRRGE